MKINIKKIYILFIASAVLGSSISYDKLYLFHLLLALLTLLSFFVKKNELYNYEKKSSLNVLEFIFYLAWFIYILNIFSSIDRFYSLQYIIYVLIGLSIILFINKFSYNFKTYNETFNILKILFLTAVVIAVLEIFTPFRLPSSPFSTYANLFRMAGLDSNFLSVIDLEEIKYIPTSFWGNPNHLAVAMIIILPFFLFSSAMMVKFFGSITVCIIILFSGSRGSFISYILGCLIYFIFFNKMKSFLFLSLLLFLIAYLFIFNEIFDSTNPYIAEFINIIPALFDYLFDDVTELNSVGIRKQLIVDGFNALIASHWLGLGPGGSILLQSNGGVMGITSMHNFWIEILVDGGIIFFSIFLFWYLFVLVKLYSIYKFSKFDYFRYHAGALFLSMLIFLPAAISASSVIYFLPMWILFGLAIALISINNIEVRKSK